MHIIQIFIIPLHLKKKKKENCGQPKTHDRSDHGESWISRPTIFCREPIHGLTWIGEPRVSKPRIWSCVISTARDPWCCCGSPWSEIFIFIFIFFMKKKRVKGIMIVLHIINIRGIIYVSSHIMHFIYAEERGKVKVSHSLREPADCNFLKFGFILSD
jgi:hypothetical protein